MKNRRKQLIARDMKRLAGEIQELQKQLVSLQAEAKADAAKIAEAEGAPPDTQPARKSEA